MFFFQFSQLFLQPIDAGSVNLIPIFLQLSIQSVQTVDEEYAVLAQIAVFGGFPTDE